MPKRNTSPQRKTADSSSLDPREISHFSRDSGQWWDETGPFSPLHRLNPVRLRYIRDRIISHFSLSEKPLTPFKNINILDIGCGGGLLAEPLARLGANVTGLDADTRAIETAKEHSQESGLSISYKAGTVEDLLTLKKSREAFDVVLAMEVVEHVGNVEDFVKNTVALCRPGGLIIFSTLNRTLKSLALGIVAAEYVLGWVPRGTHQWKKFLRPSELVRHLERAGANPIDVAGMRLDPFSGNFTLAPHDLGINYFLSAEKKP